MQSLLKGKIDSAKAMHTYVIAVITAGAVVFGAALFQLPFRNLDVSFLILAACTVGLGSRITLPIPRFKSHISVSDTFIFLTLLLYGGEAAIILAAIEAFVSSKRFCTKYSTIFFNSATLAISTATVVLVLRIIGITSEGQLHGHAEQMRDFVIALSLIALTQFLMNTSIAAIFDSLKQGIPLWTTWKEKYIWTFFSYFVGAAAAGLLIQLVDYTGFGVVFAAFPVMLFVFLTYRMYLQNVEMSIKQAEQAEQYASVLEQRTLALRESEERFRSAFNYAPIGIALVSPSGKWLKVNRALCGILGYTAAEFKELKFESVIFAEDLGQTLLKIGELLSGQIQSYQNEQRFIHKSGRTVWTYWSVSAASEASSENSDMIFQIQDITDRKIAEEKLLYEASHDSLTGLPNRAMFMTRLTEALQNTRSNSGHQVSVLFIDLDRFKYVNDSLGHVIGDELLESISKRLRECMRPSDIVARLGGDEFTILVEGDYDHVEVTRIAERIQQKFSIPFNIRGHVIYSSASIGILHASERHSTSEEMMRDADTAMYQAKRAGKARHEVFNDDMHAAAKETLQLETDLRHAVANKEFSVVYQPIFALGSNEIMGVEALARWDHPVYGHIPPSKFIPLAEEIGWIDTLGEQIFRTACTDIAEIHDELPATTPIKLSVNLSCRQFGAAEIVSNLKNILTETGFPAMRLKLEITESIFFEYQERAVAMLGQLRELGIDIDIDDFGTGYSNLSYLVRLPISTLKIDRSFVSPINDDGANTEIVRTIIALSKNLGLAVVAEGIETNAQLQALKSLGCEGGQGYLLAKPMNQNELYKYLIGAERPIIPYSHPDSIPQISAIQ